MKKSTGPIFVAALFLAGCAAPQFAPGPMMQRYTAGVSVENRSIEYLVIGAGPDVIFIMAAIHGNESAGVPLVYRLADYLQQYPGLLTGRKVVLLPAANPDGIARNSRFNANSVDLNRNFAAPNRINDLQSGYAALCEPESGIIDRLIRRYNPNRIISLHQPENSDTGWIDYDGPADDLAGRIAEYSKLPIRKLGTFPGSLGAYAGATLNIPIITIEQPLNIERLDSERLWQRYGPALVAAVIYPDKINEDTNQSHRPLDSQPQIDNNGK